MHNCKYTTAFVQTHLHFCLNSPSGWLDIIITETMRQAETIMAHLTGYNQWKNIHKLTRLKWDTTHALTLIACFSVFLVVSDDMLWCKMNLAAPLGQPLWCICRHTNCRLARRHTSTSRHIGRHSSISTKVFIDMAKTKVLDRDKCGMSRVLGASSIVL